jgi:HD-GYP domain-containing protein (c-di-GMP phosphodiesterase class II)
MAGKRRALLHDGPCPAELRRAAALVGWDVANADATAEDAVLVLLNGDRRATHWRARWPGALIVAIGDDGSGADLAIPASAPGQTWSSLLTLAARHAESHATLQKVAAELDARDSRIQQLSEISCALANERDPSRLLETILTEGRRISGSDAGSLYLIDHRHAPSALVFKLAQNDSIQVSLEETRLPISTRSLSGYVAVTGEELNIPDAYAIGDQHPYAFNPSFDQSTGYRTRSLLVLPMRDHRGCIVGVLQFINRKVRGTVVPFDADVATLLQAVAGQAAVAIQKNGLLSDISTLFESFVQASVKAIEQRDPSTSGHSFRVAEYTTRLLEALPRSGLARFRDLTLTEEHLTEVRYAALLHDFGKVGVREAVLVKANKLTDERLEVIRYRFELQKERLRRRALEEELELLHHGQGDFEVARRRARRALAQELSRLDDFLSALTLANNPNVRAEGEYGHLAAIHALPFLELDGGDGRLIAASDVEALSVRRGSLTPEERREIQNHVVHTRDFLAVLPWPPELERVPLIAAAHHEKLDGSGYPLGLRGDAIPLPSRVMAICDIFDALTAMDRPYKPALSSDAALRILDDEVRGGMLDRDVFDVFVASEVYRAASSTARTPEPNVRASVR